MKITPTYPLTKAETAKVVMFRHDAKIFVDILLHPNGVEDAEFPYTFILCPMSMQWSLAYTPRLSKILSSYRIDITDDILCRIKQKLQKVYLKVLEKYGSDLTIYGMLRSKDEGVETETFNHIDTLLTKEFNRKIDKLMGKVKIMEYIEE